MNRVKRLFLFNPYNLLKEETNYKTLMEQTELGKATLSSYKHKKYLMKRFNAFLVDEKTSLKELRDLAESVSIKDEVWAKIPGFPNTISTYGRVKSERTNSFMIPFLNRSGYLAIRLKRDGKTFSMPLHRLVAIVFIPKDNDDGIYYAKCKDFLGYLFQDSGSGDLVYHKNNNKHDNRVCNLMWASIKQICRGRRKKSVPVVKLCKNTGNPLDRYDSINDAGEENFISPTAIGQCLQGKTKTSGGFRWCFDKGQFDDYFEKEWVLNV